MPEKKIPQNSRLWNMIVAQAKAKYRTYPSPAASHWVHKEYEKRGGRFVTSRKDTEESKKKSAQSKKRSSSSSSSKKKTRSK